MAITKYNSDDLRKAVDRLKAGSIWPEDIEAIIQAADAMEREEREKKYEYVERYKDGRRSAFYTKTIEELKITMSPFSTILRREVGEWEEVKDGK